MQLFGERDALRSSGPMAPPHPIPTLIPVTLIGAKPGEQRFVAAELQGERYGRHQGRLVVSTPNDSVVLTP